MPTVATVSRVEQFKATNGRVISIITTDISSLEVKRMNMPVRIVTGDGRVIEANAGFTFAKPIDAPASFVLDVQPDTDIPIGSHIEFAD